MNHGEPHPRGVRAATVLLSVAAATIAHAGAADDAALDAAIRSDPRLSAPTATDADSQIRLGGFTQFRYLMNFRDGPASSATASDSGFTNGFEMARTRLEATGNLHGEDLAFTLSGELGRTGKDLTLLDAYAEARLDNRYSLDAGQFRLPLWREWSVDETRQLAANSSLVTEAFNPGYTQGIALKYTDDRFRLHTSLTDGIRAANTPYASSSEADVALAARAEIKGAAGSWSLFDDFAGWRGQPTAWTSGVGFIFHHTGGTASSETVPQRSLMILAADVGVEGSGWNVYGAAVAVRADPDAGDIRITDGGVVLQGGYFVTDAVEVFGRWDAVFPDAARGPAVAMDSQTITAGANWYLFPKSHMAKVTGDVQWFINEMHGNGVVRPLADTTNIDFRSDREGDQFTFRFQFQVVF